jgi:RNA polymerase sigma factor (sigma-70 family)
MNSALREHINNLIRRLRAGDPEAEKKLYERYYRRIGFYVYRNVWFPEIKDPENVIGDVWLKLRDWFMRNDIEKSERSVVYNQVRSFCRSAGTKDKLEPSYGSEPTKSHFTDKEEENDKEPLLPVHTEILKKIFVYDYGQTNIPEKERTFKARLYNILSKCLKNLTERELKIIDWAFFHDYDFVKIAEMIGRSNVTAGNACKGALKKLRRCFSRHNIHSLEDLL